MSVALIVPGSPLLSQMSHAAWKTAMLMPPLGLVQLAGYLRANGVETTIIDAVRRPMDPQRCAQALIELSPRLIGFSVLTWNYCFTVQTVKALRRGGWGGAIVFGNIHAAVFRERILSEGWADYVVVGEGERPLLELARRIEAGQSGVGIPGVISAVQINELCNGPSLLVENLDELPLPDWSLIDIGWYLDRRLPIAREALLPICASRGCRFNCSFCSQEKYVPRFRHRSVAGLIGEIERDLCEFDTHGLAFLDAAFPWSEEFGIEFCDTLVKTGLDRRIGWWCETRADVVTPRLLKSMVRAGCRHILYGFESGEPRMLLAMNKGLTVERSLKAAAWTREAGLPFHAFLIIGYPGETIGSALRTIRLALRLRPTTAKFHLAMPMPGSRFYQDVKHLLKIDLSDPQSAAGFTSWNNWSLHLGRPVFVPAGMSARTLQALYWLAHLLFYGRPWKIVSLLRSGQMRASSLWYAGLVLVEGMLHRGSHKEMDCQEGRSPEEETRRAEQ
ncbi:MAG: radical SAM protein [Candidatus Alcyoniella australis]|nr:radical SAM protein [Candidatus Alcyoniella australis]